MAIPARERVRGADLKPGDVIIPWYEKTATIAAIEPYTGPNTVLFPAGVVILKFTAGSDFGARGMTCDLGDFYKRVL